MDAGKELHLRRTRSEGRVKETRSEGHVKETQSEGHLKETASSARGSGEAVLLKLLLKQLWLIFNCSIQGWAEKFIG